ncbi:MAG: glycine oxidase [Acidimicrobiaceae bacterium]|nr:glycine oxidase [Acidimicrobiaceae bacterium]
MQERFDMAIAGAGVIGSTVAWRLAETGRRVCLVDPLPGRGASYAAAGMLAPVAEAAYGEEVLLGLNLRAAASWSAFAGELEACAGQQIGFEQSGTLLVAYDPGDRKVLAEVHGYQNDLGLSARWCTPSECRRLEPALAPGVHAGVLAEGDARVDNRRLMAALGAACMNAGVTVVTATVDEVLIESGRARGLLASGRELLAPTVLLAAGHATGALSGLPTGLLPPVRPVKGQILRMRSRDREPLLTRTVHAIVEGSNVYLVPRSGGRLVVGATVEERGEDVTVTAAGVHEVLHDALAVVPAIDELELVEALARLRPGSPDNAPIVGPTAVEGLLIATGHYRNGILLAPVTAEALLALLTEGELPGWAAAFSPARFAERRSEAGVADGPVPASTGT